MTTPYDVYACKMKCREAATLYQKRQNGEAKALGFWSEQGLWFPYLTERRPCCESFGNASLKGSRALYRHQKTLKHVAAVYNLPLADVRAALQEIRKGA